MTIVGGQLKGETVGDPGEPVVAAPVGHVRVEVRIEGGDKVLVATMWVPSLGAPEPSAGNRAIVAWALDRLLRAD